MSRNSKISLLPRDVREKLNARIRDGEAGPPLLEWLNGLPKVKKLVARRFAGIDISPANLSAWRRGGYKNWLLHREALDLSGELVADAHSLDDEYRPEKQEPGQLTEGMAAILATRLARLISNWGGIGEKQFDRELQALRMVSREVARLRRDDHNVVRLELRKEAARDYSEHHSMRNWMKKLLKWAKDDEKLSSFLASRWPFSNVADECFLRALGFTPDEIRGCLAEPDKLPPWEKEETEEPENN